MGAAGGLEAWRVGGEAEQPNQRRRQSVESAGHGGSQPGRDPWAEEDSGRVVLQGGALRAGAWKSGHYQEGMRGRALGASSGARIKEERWISPLQSTTV